MRKFALKIPSALLWRMVAAVVLAALLAKWSWVVFAPEPGVAVSMWQPANSPDAERLFGSAASAPLAQGAQDAQFVKDLRLIGVFTGLHAFAIVELDKSRQLGIRLGEELKPGIRLLEVARDHIILGDEGRQQRLNIEENPDSIVSAKAADVPVVHVENATVPEVQPVRPAAPAGREEKKLETEMEKMRRKVNMLRGRDY